MRNVLTLVLGGGKGTRLYPLTKHRSKPAVPLAGRYRLIDVPISNCLTSGLNQIYVVTQFNSASLNRHISQTYQFDPFGGGFVDILAAQQTTDNTDWYQGTADAVRQNLRYVLDHDVDYVLILSGDQLYRMDYTELLKTHIDSKAHVTIAALPVEEEEAKACGILRLDPSARVTGFLEKPQSRHDLDMVKTAPAAIDAHGIKSHGREYLASMGIYVFNRDTLVEALEKTPYHDFGKEIFPTAIRTRHVQAYLFDDYWEDIGTIRAFYDANLKLASREPPFEFVSDGKPIFSRARYLPPSRIEGAIVRNSLIADGCQIEAGAVIENSVIGVRSHIGPNVTVRNSIVMGADFFESPAELAANAANGLPRIGLGEGTLVEGAIVDKNCRVGRFTKIKNTTGHDTSPETQEAMIVDGIILLTKGAVLKDGWTMHEF